MALDAQTLADFRKIVAEQLTDSADVFRKTLVPTQGQSPVTASDGMGGIIYNSVAISEHKDQRTKIYDNLPCRVTVPKANRSDAEYEKEGVRVSESRATIVFAHDADIKESDRIDVNFRGITRSYEVQVIADHAESYSLQVNCVELKVERI